MNWLTQAWIDVRVRLRAIFRRNAERDRLREEMQTHLAMREASLMASNVTAGAARRKARRDFGNIAALAESAADVWKYGSLERLQQDLRYGVRTLARAPGFTLIAITLLALGIGVNATVFSVANEYLLKRLPVAAADRVVRVYSNRFSNSPQALFESLRDRNATLEGLAAYAPLSAGFRIDQNTEHTIGQIVSGNYFPVLRLAASRGRLLSPDDDRADAVPVAVLAEPFWQRRLAGSSDVIGRTLTINDRAFTIVGVLKPGFSGAMAPFAADFWVPLSADALLRPGLDRAARLESLSVQMLGRMKPDVTRERAEADLDTIGRQYRAAYDPANTGVAVSVYPAMMLHPEIAGPVAVFVSVLMVIVGLVLLIVCVNIANLVLARAAPRDTEIAIRQSMGAGRGRLVRQLLTENLLLSSAGAVGGIAMAFWLTRLIGLAAAALPSPIPLVMHIAIDIRVLAFVIAIVLMATLAFGIVPALGASRMDLVRVLKGLDAAGRRQGRARAGFLVAQVSMSVLLLVVAALFILALRSAHRIDTGFKAEQVLTASIDLEARGYSPDRGREFVRSLVERLNAAPGIVSANVVDILPLTLSNRAQYFRRETDPALAPGRGANRTSSPTPIVYMNAVAPGHFATLEIGVLDGRDFNTQDNSGAPLVGMVNETMARRFWPGRRAIGQRVRPAGEDGAWIEIVGIVRDSKYVTVGEEQRSFLYQPFAQAYAPRPSLLVRSAGAWSAALSPVRTVVREMDAGLPVFNVASLEDATAISLLPVRFAGRLLTVLGVLAVALSALGTYGVLSFLVRSRSRELAVRLALGAPPHLVAAMVIRQALVWTGVGVAIGLGIAVLLTRFLRAFLYGVDPLDPRVLIGVAGLIAAVACAAAWPPARRASRQDPLVTLRNG